MHRARSRSLPDPGRACSGRFPGHCNGPRRADSFPDPTYLRWTRKAYWVGTLSPGPPFTKTRNADGGRAADAPPVRKRHEHVPTKTTSPAMPFAEPGGGGLERRLRERWGYGGPGFGRGCFARPKRYHNPWWLTRRHYYGGGMGYLGFSTSKDVRIPFSLRWGLSPNSAPKAYSIGILYPGRNAWSWEPCFEVWFPQSLISWPDFLEG